MWNLLAAEEFVFKSALGHILSNRFLPFFQKLPEVPDGAALDEVKECLVSCPSQNRKL